jgi:hypothetical protein
MQANDAAITIFPMLEEPLIEVADWPRLAGMLQL